MNIFGTSETFSPEFIVCPECGTKCIPDFITPVSDGFSGLLAGYYIVCSGCFSRTYINILGRPPLFDLSSRTKSTIDLI